MSVDKQIISFRRNNVISTKLFLIYVMMDCNAKISIAFDFQHETCSFSSPSAIESLLIIGHIFSFIFNVFYSFEFCDAIRYPIQYPRFVLSHSLFSISHLIIFIYHFVWFSPYFLCVCMYVQDIIIKQMMVVWESSAKKPGIFRIIGDKIGRPAASVRNRWSRRLSKSCGQLEISPDEFCIKKGTRNKK
jgi:hypothetical protein